jgi:hypothetical protein
MTPATIARIETQFLLPAERTEIQSDFQYQSTQANGKIIVYNGVRCSPPETTVHYKTLNCLPNAGKIDFTPVAIHFNLTTELRNKKGQLFQSGDKLLRKRSFAQGSDRALIFAKRALSGNLSHDPNLRRRLAKSFAASLYMKLQGGFQG